MDENWFINGIVSLKFEYFGRIKYHGGLEKIILVAGGRGWLSTLGQGTLTLSIPQGLPSMVQEMVTISV